MRKLAGQRHVAPHLALMVALAAIVTVGPSAPTAAAREGSCRPVEEVVATDLGDLGGTSGTYAADLNNRGEVVGRASTATGDDHAFLWRRGVMTDLTPWLRGSSIAVATNDRSRVLLRWSEADTWREGVILRSRHGEIAIDSYNPLGLNERGQALLADIRSVWDHGVLVSLPERIDGMPIYVTGLGDGGHVIGMVEPVPEPGGGHPGPAGAFVWKDGTATRLDIDPFRFRGNEPIDVDRRGRVLVNALDPAGRSTALLWDDGEYVDLGSLAGPGGDTTGVDLNDRGQVVGTSTTTGGDTHAFLWQDGEMVDLDGVAGRRSYATAIGDRGHVAGYSLTGEWPFAVGTGFLWWCGEMVDLPQSRGDRLYGPVNSRGQVVGPVLAPTSAPHAALFTPVRP